MTCSGRAYCLMKVEPRKQKVEPRKQKWLFSSYHYCTMLNLFISTSYVYVYRVSVGACLTGKVDVLDDFCAIARSVKFFGFFGHLYFQWKLVFSHQSILIHVVGYYSCCNHCLSVFHSCRFGGLATSY